MFRIKLCMALMACLLTACACAESIIPDEMIKDEKAHYDTLTLEYGTFEYGVAASADKFYPAAQAVRCSQQNARFLEYCVDRGDAVKQGDVLAVFTLEFDEARLTELSLALERAEAALESDILDARENLEALELALLKAASSQEKTLARLRLERAEVELASMLDSRSRQIADMEAQIAELEAQRADDKLIAPMDGVVSEVEYKRVGDRVYDGERMLIIERTDIMLLRVDNASGAFRYGMDVMVEVSVGGKNTVQLSGKVVCADALVPTAHRTGSAYIAVENPDNIKIPRAKVHAAKISMENVLTLPRSAVDLDGGRHYVMQLIDGIPQKRFISCVVQTGARDVWVVQGLEAGDEIIVD